MSESPLSLPIVVARETPADAASVDRLVARVFGPGRFARTAYRLRERARRDPSLCFVARVSTLLVGSNRMSLVEAGAVPGLMLGPLTVDPAFRRQGIGHRLVEASLAATADGRHGFVILVGDLAYYGRFGFVRVPGNRLTLPGPVDPARVLIRDLAPGASDRATGLIRAVEASP